MNVAGFFAGVGGIELGFANQGFNVVWSNEIDKKACVTFAANHHNTLINEDINALDISAIQSTDVIVGGFPCQAFSIAGYRKGFEDERGEVFFRMAKIIKEKKPKVIFIENVKNLFTHDKGNTYKVIKETLESFGYHLCVQVLNAATFGNVPQNRERIYIIGFLDKDAANRFIPLEPVELNTSIGDIIDDKNKLEDKYYYTKENCPFYDKLKQAIVRKDTLYQWRRKYVRENKSNICPTLTANMGTGGHNVPLVLTQFGIRKLTPRECFLFQGFPRDFILPESLANSHLYKQAGNSVVVPVIERLAQAIKSAL